MRFWLEITNASGTLQGRVDNCLYWRGVARLDKAGAFEFAIPAADTKASLLVNQYRAYCYGLVDGVVTELGAGIIDRIVTRQQGQAAPVIVVSGDDLLRELAVHRTIAAGGNYAEYSNSTVAPSSLIAFAITPTFPANWTLGGAGSTVGAIYARFGNQSILYGLGGIAQTTGEHFRYTSSRTVTWLGASSSFSASGILATTSADPESVAGEPSTCLITDIEQVLDSYDQITRLFLYGAGEAEARLDLTAVETWPYGFVDGTTGTRVMTFASDIATATIGGDTWKCDRSLSYLENQTARTASGYLMREAQFAEVAPLSNTDADLADAADYLLQAGYNEMRTRTSAQRSYRLELAGLDAVLQVGTTLGVLARSVTEDADGARTYIDIERSDLIVLETETKIDERGAHTVGVMVSTADRWPATNESAVIDNLNESHAARVLPQMNASVDTSRYSEPIDDDYSADLWFWLSDYVTTVNQVVLRFRVDPLRSTVKSVTGGASSASTTVSGGSSSPTSGTGDHVHPINIPAGTIAVNVGIDAGGGIVKASGATATPSTQFETGSHSHTVTISAHDHGMEHTHSSTGVYGIYEESGANTYAYSDLEFLVNGSAASDTPSAISGASGWYEVDLTADVVDSVGRPVQAANYVTVQVKAASYASKTVQVTAEIERRTVIQSIATV